MSYLKSQEDLVATAAYAPEPAAVSAARRFVRETLRAWELPGPAWGQLIDDAVLLTSELVTNAVLHAGTPVQVTCRLLADCDQGEDVSIGLGGQAGGHRGGAVEIAVLDRRPAQLRPVLPDTPADRAERVSGRGLQLPSALASAWGVTYAREAKAVWFRMVLPEPENEQRSVPVPAGCRGHG
jgi:anti-sigma regulatory factor (Ser/Thr protein kinase)